MSKPSRLSRLAKLGGLTSKVTGSFIGNKVKDAFRNEEMRKKAREKLQIDNAKEIVAQVSKMKGAAMKLGQQMAIAADALDLPDEVAQTLGTLNKDAEPIPFAHIREDLESELGRPMAELFARFDEVPIGTASLGQAHGAALPDGTEVVVKVLHRGVEHSVDTDLLALKAVLLSSRAIRRPKAEVDRIFGEIRDRLMEELDYLQEAANIHVYQKLFEGEDWIRIPTLHQGYCTERVLTMDRLPGVHIDEFVQTGSPEARQRAAVGLAELYYRQAFEFRTLHSDPHPGNFLFEPDGRIGLIDYGCIKRFDEFWIGTYARCAEAIYRNDRDEALKQAVELGSWDGKGDKAGDVLWAYLDAIGCGFRQGVITLGADDEQFVEPVVKAGRQLVKYPNITLPQDIIMLHRALGGLYTLSRHLRAPVDYGQIVLGYSGRAIARAEGRL
ncbi:MAG: AarF/ABC1/UbiB kinase family protein [Alphaproteobacteria bacterium]|nr:AarF/ABC1/UbiB kinase family protein [Alphaproteobacteria bacterium]